mmetsp:Transcript_86562/g.242454  ORF Transcript_86562/g.242454 Transcript_86562/m.242454 type:complete len:220 (-) Transcript_86562:149-808(-)
MPTDGPARRSPPLLAVLVCCLLIGNLGNLAFTLQRWVFAKPVGLRFQVQRHSLPQPFTGEFESKPLGPPQSSIETPTDLVPPPEAEQFEGGATMVLQPGKAGGKSPGAYATVLVHYAVWKADTGELYDTSYVDENQQGCNLLLPDIPGRKVKEGWCQGEPVEFYMGQVLLAWSQGVQKMVEGEKRRLWLPSEQAYRNGDLVFDIELIKITDEGGWFGFR